MIKKGAQVKILTGKDKNKDGEIIQQKKYDDWKNLKDD